MRPNARPALRCRASSAAPVGFHPCGKNMALGTVNRQLGGDEPTFAEARANGEVAPIAPFQSIRGRVIRIGSARRPTGNAAEGMTDWSEAIDLRAERREKGLRLGEFGELSGRREALDRRCQNGVPIGVATGCAIKHRLHIPVYHARARAHDRKPSKSAIRGPNPRWRSRPQPAKPAEMGRD